MLIGELADLAGTTVRAIRHYHAEGLLPEPIRDSLGYRRYGMADLTRLVRIRQLRDAGLPVDRIPAALSGDLTAHLDAFDAELAEQERAIALQRKRIAELRGSTVELPERVVGLYDHLAANGVRADLIELDRQAWQLVATTAPGLLAEFDRMLAAPQAREQWLDLALQLQDGTGDPAELAGRLTALLPKFPEADDLPPAVRKLIATFLDPFNQVQHEVTTRVTGVDLP
ncbi:MerR family transcriptional regulator [Lentzea tibetensis]|uniref:MerR family transcriptional regulator n=1 Tax=Lentzea tibetensis TaxID=2591470 RepID=A0A563EM07_9PSEU|nr:MerR family transcriptional regulator [Lentzea tibetensis]TWP48193.1 MerR family transcriptional regulator [Lentzea tibetensis]